MIRALFTALLSIAFCGCSTSLDSGTTHFRTYANVAALNLTAPGVSLVMTDVNHSTPTHTAFNGAAQFLGTAGAAALPFTRTSNVVKAAAIVPAIVPAFRMTPGTPRNLTVTLPAPAPQIIRLRPSPVVVREIPPVEPPAPAPVAKPFPHIEKTTPPVITAPIEPL